MKKFGVVLLSGISVFGFVDSKSQSTVETALLFSRTTPGGTARALGMGGVQVGLGGDISSASSNPAGLGMFNRSEFTISPSASWVNSQSEFFGNSTDVLKAKLSIPSISYAMHRGVDNGGQWLGGTFAISLHRLNDFNSTMEYEGTNPFNSIADYLAIDSDGIDPKDFEDKYYNTLNRLAYSTFITDTLTQDNFLYYISPVGVNFFDDKDLPRSRQSETIKTTGSQNQWSFSYGANFSDKFFFGASLHIRSIRYGNKKTYSESDYYFEKAPTFDPLNSLILEEELQIIGSGFSGTFGAMIRPVDGFQIGVSYNTPTSYFLRDTYNARMSADWNNFDYYGDGGTVLNFEQEALDEIISEYKLKTPGRLSIGSTYFFEKVAFISADVDFTDYSSAQYTSQTEGVDYNEDNDEIADIYKTGVNFRLGGEYRLKSFRFRAGLGYQNDPFITQQNGISRSIVSYAIGCGYRTTRFYVDLALTAKTGSNSYGPYSVPGNNSPLVNIQNVANAFNFTLGFPF